MIELTLYRIVTRNNISKRDKIASVILPKFLPQYLKLPVENNKSLNKTQALFIAQKLSNISTDIQLEISDLIVAKKKQQAQLLQNRADLLNICSFTLSTLGVMISENVIMTVSINQ